MTGFLEQTVPSPRRGIEDLPFMNMGRYDPTLGLEPAFMVWLHCNHTVDGSEILHQFEVGSLSHYSQGFIHPKWCRISSINSMVPSPEPLFLRFSFVLCNDLATIIWTTKKSGRIQGSLNYPFWGESNNTHLFIFRDFPYHNALFGLVI